MQSSTTLRQTTVNRKRLERQGFFDISASQRSANHFYAKSTNKTTCCLLKVTLTPFDNCKRTCNECRLERVNRRATVLRSSMLQTRRRGVISPLVPLQAQKHTSKLCKRSNKRSSPLQRVPSAFASTSSREGGLHERKYYEACRLSLTSVVKAFAYSRDSALMNKRTSSHSQEALIERTL